jgi:hypothetical protein
MKVWFVPLLLNSKVLESGGFEIESKLTDQ